MPSRRVDHVMFHVKQQAAGFRTIAIVADTARSAWPFRDTCA
jgi:hypothetical protein